MQALAAARVLGLWRRVVPNDGSQRVDIPEAVILKAALVAASGLIGQTSTASG